MGNANISSGGDFAHFGSHAWHDGTNWQFDSTAGGLYQISGQTHNWYKHNGSGSFTKLMTLDPAGYLKLGDAVTGVTPGIFAKDLAPNYSILGFYPQSGTNVNMSFQVFPKGTGQGGNVAQFSVFGTDGVADVNNIEFMTARATGTSFLLASGQGGTGILRPVILSAPPK